MGCNKSKPKNPSLTEDNNGPDDLMVDENSGTGGTIFFAQRVDRRKQSDVSLENILNNPPIYQAFQVNKGDCMNWVEVAFSLFFIILHYFHFLLFLALRPLLNDFLSHY